VSGHVYIVSHDGQTKLGFTTRLKERAEAYRCHNPLFRQFDWSHEAQKDDEPAIHRALRQRGFQEFRKEWFRASFDEVRRAAELYFKTLKSPTQKHDLAQKLDREERQEEARILALKKSRRRFHRIGLAKKAVGGRVHLRAVDPQGVPCDWPLSARLPPGVMHAAFLHVERKRIKAVMAERGLL
jgi:hypothetical protein